MSKRLTAEMIIMRSRGNYDLSQIKKLNFWGQSLGDISVLSQCVSLESATFSQNFITSLRCFSGMNNLRELSLAKNSISDLREINYLSTCRNLRKLWLKDNPISNRLDYRIQVIKILPNLMYLDDEEVTPDERQNINTGSFFDNNYNQPKYENRNDNIRVPSYDPFNGQKNYRNNFQEYGGVYNRYRRDYEPEEIGNNNENYIGILPGMVDQDKKYFNNNNNQYDKYQNKRVETPGKVYDRYGSGKRRQSPFNNDNNNNFRRLNSNNINGAINIGYNNYGRNIPGSAESHYRRYENNNQMEVSTNATQQGQQRVVDCVSVLLKGLSNDELLYIAEHIDKKISKI